MFKKVLLAAALFAGPQAANAAPAMTCGQARADLRVCLSSWGLPSGASGATINLYYPGNEAYALTVTGYDIYPGDAQRGIRTYLAYGTVRNTPSQFLLAVNYGASTLPTWPPISPKAQLFYAAPGAPTWTLVAGTYQFDFGGNPAPFAPSAAK